MSADVIPMRRCAADADADVDLPEAVQGALDTLTRASECTADSGLVDLFNSTAAAVRSSFDPAVAAVWHEQVRWTPVERAVLRLAEQVLAGAR